MANSLDKNADKAEKSPAVEFSPSTVEVSFKENNTAKKINAKLKYASFHFDGVEYDYKTAEANPELLTQIAEAGLIEGLNSTGLLKEVVEAPKKAPKEEK
jgi:hypothetical protein